MLKNYIRTALQYLSKNKAVAAINIFGLSIAIAVCGYIYLLITHELGYDQFHKDAARIYRLNTTFKYPNSPERPTALSASPMGAFLAAKSPDIEASLKILPVEQKKLYYYENKKIAIDKLITADTSFFSFFDFPLLYGNPRLVLSDPNNIVIAEEVSNRLFGPADPTGKILASKWMTDSGKDTASLYTVADVFKALPANTHLHFDAIRPTGRQDVPDKESRSWHGVQHFTYFKLRSDKTDPAKTAASFPSFLKDAMDGYNYVGLSLQSLREVHLHSSRLEYDTFNHNKFDNKYIWILAIVAIFLMAIAIVNFTNLSTVLANQRLKETAIRKSIGASRSQVLLQFLTESTLTALLATGIALFFLYFAVPWFNSISGRMIAFGFSPAAWTTIILLTFLLAGMAGLYPALMISGLPAVKVFGQHKTGISIKRPLIKSLVVVQFSLSVVLVVSLQVIYSQFRFIQNYKLGFTTSQTLYIKMGSNNSSDYPAFKEDVKRIAGVVDVSAASELLGDIHSQNGVMVRDPKTLQWTLYPMPRLFADHNFLSFYNIQLAKGENFTAAGVQTGREYIVNEAFAKRVGIENPVGVLVNTFSGDTGKIVGVAKNFNQASLHHAIEPLIIQATSYIQYVSVKVATGNLSRTIEDLGKTWQRYIKDVPFEYHFVDEYFENLYDNEKRLSRIIMAAAVLAIIIACMGLFAMASFVTLQRVKEIGIRKVLGARVGEIITLLSVDYLKPVLIAIVVAIPVAWYLMHTWLQDFAYRINMSWWMFAGGSVITVMIALLTVSIHSLKASLANPVKSLRSE